MYEIFFIYLSSKMMIQKNNKEYDKKEEFYI